MNPEDKIAVFVKDYGLVAEAQLKNRKSGRSWKIIVVEDGELFWESIFCSTIEGEKWKAEDLKLIIELLHKNVWFLNQDEDIYMIDENLYSIDGKIGEEAIYLKLACIALLGDDKDKPFIKAVMDIVCYKKTMVTTVCEDKLNFLSKQLVSNWGKKLNFIFVSYFGNKDKDKVILDRIYSRHKNFIVNSRLRNSMAFGINKN